MLLNVSYNNRKIKEITDKEVGESFSIRERLKMQGIGSPKLFITSTSIEINKLLILDNNTNVCNIEIRPKGIIVGFRSLLESFALVIPFYKLSIYKGKADEYSIYKDHYFIKIRATKQIHSFIKKIMTYKAAIITKSHKDL